MRTEKQGTYLLFFMIGILSFLIGIFLGEDILGLSGLETVCFILLVYSVLFAIGLYVSKRWPLGFIVKAFVVSFIALFLIPIAATIGFALQPPEPLSFSIYNGDIKEHTVIVEVTDSTMPIFNETYVIGPKERVDSPVLAREEGEYLFKVTWNDEITETYKAVVERYRGPVAAYISNYTGNVTFWIGQSIL